GDLVVPHALVLVVLVVDLVGEAECDHGVAPGSHRRSPSLLFTLTWAPGKHGECAGALAHRKYRRGFLDLRRCTACRGRVRPGAAGPADASGSAQHAGEAAGAGVAAVGVEALVLE